MTVALEQLRQADCLFSSDRVPHDPQMTAFKREARYRQHLWAKSQGITQFGTHANTPAGVAAGGPERIPNGTKLTDTDAESGANFLSPKIWDVVQKRIAEPQPLQTLDPDRLRRDLLSSMPMAFNLFGEATANPEARLALAQLFAPDVTLDPAHVDIVFEWSPQRRSPMYTRDRTAFDVAIRIGDGPQTVVGIETKYHEDAKLDREASPEQQDFLIGIAESSGAFKPGWQDKVLATPLRQVWRDHLLALSMRNHPNLWTSATRYVLIYPAGNCSYATVADEYQAVLASSGSFRALTLEQVVDSAFAHDKHLAERFKSRYL